MFQFYFQNIYMNDVSEKTYNSGGNKSFEMIRLLQWHFKFEH